MMRLVAPRQFLLDAAVLDWTSIARRRKDDNSDWMDDLRERGIGNGSTIQLRWMLRAASSDENDPEPALGMPTEPFQVWIRRPVLKDMKALDFFPPVTAPLGTVIRLKARPQAYVRVSFDLAGQPALALALSGPPGLESIAAFVAVPAGSTSVVLGASHIVAVQFVTQSGTPCSVQSIQGISAQDYANSDEWKLLELVGLPVDGPQWHAHAGRQGMMGHPLSPVEAALDRLRRGAAPFGWPLVMGNLPAPDWKRPDFKGLVSDVEQDLLHDLYQAMQLPPRDQAAFTLERAVESPQGASGTMQDASTATYAPLSMLLMGVSTDPLLALACGFGTAYTSLELGDAKAVHEAANLRPDFMVTARWEKGLDGQSAPLEMAALAIHLRPPLAIPSPAHMQALEQSLSRPPQPDSSWSTGVQIGWDRLPEMRLLRPCSHAVARGDPARPAQRAQAVMSPRPSGGVIPLALVAPHAQDPTPHRLHALDPGLELPLSTAPAWARYGITLQDIWGQWSAWSVTDFQRAQPPLDPPRVLHMQLQAIPRQAGRVCDGVLTLDLAVDWKVRRPQSIEIVCRLFDAPLLGDTPLPDSSVPSGVQWQAGGAIASPVSIAFAGDADTLPAAGPVSMTYYDLQGDKLVTPGPVDNDPQQDTRRYRIRIEGFALDYSAHRHIGIAVWCRVRERAAPQRVSAWPSTPPAGPALAFASDPIPPVLDLPTPALASLPDAAGECHVRLLLPLTVAGVIGYFIYESSESQLLGLEDGASAGLVQGPDMRQGLAQRLARVLALMRHKAVRQIFTRRNASPIVTRSSIDIALPRGSRDMHFYVLIGVNAGNIESAWPTGEALIEQVQRFVAPQVSIPPAPLLEVRRMATGTPSDWATHVDIRSQPGAQVSHFELFRTRAEAAVRSLDAMGPPVATISGSGNGWTMEPLPAPDGVSLQRATGQDDPGGSWKRVWYRAVAWGTAEDDEGTLAGRSEPSAAVSVVIPPAAAPDLSPLTAVWPGGSPDLVEVQFSSTAPWQPTALGPHELRAHASAGKTPMLSVELPLDRLPTTAPAADSGAWRIALPDAGTTQYRLLLRRADIQQPVAISVHLVDPLGRTTERLLAIPAGPIDPDPDVLGLNTFGISGRGTVISWQSHAPTEPRSSGHYRLSITLTPKSKPPGIPRPVPNPRPPRPGRLTPGELLRKSWPVERAVEPAILRTPSIPDIESLTGKPKPVVITMNLAEVPLAGTPQNPVEPDRAWRLERNAGLHGLVSYTLFYAGSLDRVTVSITAPDGRHAQASR